MNEHINQLNQAKNILSGILGTALNSLDNKYVVQEAKNHIRQAIVKLESVSKKQIRKQKNATSDAQLWGNATAKVAHTAVSRETAQAVMGNLNKMISEERQKLMDLEKKSVSTQNDDDLLMN